MKKSSVSIGIPAYNEEANIAYLLRSLLAQNQKTYILKEVVVISDGSTDRTNERVKSVNDKRITLIWNQKRLGLNTAQNILMGKVKSDILVIVNGDVLINGNNYLDSLIAPLLKNKKVGLVGSSYYALRMSHGWGRVYGNSLEFRRYIYSKLLKPNNVYLCHGCARAFSKPFYKKLRWPNDVPEDAYSFLFTLKSGYTFVYNRNARVYVHPSTNVRDHARQSTRFVRGIIQLKKYFPEEVIRREYRIPFPSLAKATLIYAWKKPISMPLYFLSVTLIRVMNVLNHDDHSKFRISESSKKWSLDTLSYNRISLRRNIFEKKI